MTPEALDQFLAQQQSYTQNYLELCSLLDTQPSAESWYKLGILLLERNLLLAAARRFQQALTLDPSYLPIQEALQTILPKAQALQQMISIPEREPCVSVIMLTYNQLSYTQAALSSLLAKTPELQELILIDNASSDGTAQWLETFQAQHGERVRLVLNPTNLGFAAGCNQGLAIAQADYLLLLNNDVLLTHGWLARLLQALEQAPADMVGPVASNISGLQAALDIPAEMLAEADILEDYAQQRAIFFQGQGQAIHRLAGTCLLLKRSVLDKIGGLDPCFGFGNFEDDDFCYRALLAGFKLWIAKDAFIHHFGSKSFAVLPLDVDQLKQRNYQLFCDKWGLTAPWSAASLREPIPEIMQQPWTPERFIPLD